MSYFVNAAPVDDNNSIEYKKKNRNQTLKRAPRPKLPNISFAEDNDVEGLADFKPLAPPKIREPHQNSKMDGANSEFVEEGFTNEDLVSEYPQKYSEKPMSKMQQHIQFMSNIKNNIHPINSQLEKPDCPIHNHNMTAESLSAHQKELQEKIDYIVKMLENQKNEKTDGVLEDVILYSFLGIFMIFLVESFTKAGKYVR